jgi:uncharacterized protein
MGFFLKRAALAVAIMLAFAGAAFAAPTFPALTGRVVDDAHVLTPEVQAQLTQQLADLETRTTRQLVVVTLPSLQGYEIEDYGYQLGRAWGIGQKKLNNGALFIIAPSEHRVRIEVGYGLEPVLTDALSSVILNTTVLPKFKSGDMQGGIVAGTDAIVKQLLLDAPAAKAQVAAADQQQTSDGDDSGGWFNWGLVVVIVIIFLVVYGWLFGGSGLASLGFFVLSGLLSGGGDSDSDGGGGFSGGGGSFGGGGASGSW